MDEIDRKLLAILQEDATLTVAQIADRVGLSATPCWNAFTVTIASPAPADEIEALRDAVDRTCPILNLLRRPQPIAARVVHAAALSPPNLLQPTGHEP